MNVSQTTPTLRLAHSSASIYCIMHGLTSVRVFFFCMNSASYLSQRAQKPQDLCPGRCLARYIDTFLFSCISLLSMIVPSNILILICLFWFHTTSARRHQSLQRRECGMAPMGDGPQRGHLGTRCRRVQPRAVDDRREALFFQVPRLPHWTSNMVKDPYFFFFFFHLLFTV